MVSRLAALAPQPPGPPAGRVGRPPGADRSETPHAGKQPRPGRWLRCAGRRARATKPTRPARVVSWLAALAPQPPPESSGPLRLSGKTLPNYFRQPLCTTPISGPTVGGRCCNRPMTEAAQTTTETLLGALRANRHAAADIEVERLELTVEWAVENTVTADGEWAAHQVSTFGDRALADRRPWSTAGLGVRADGVRRRAGPVHRLRQGLRRQDPRAALPPPPALGAGGDRPGAGVAGDAGRRAHPLPPDGRCRRRRPGARPGGRDVLVGPDRPARRGGPGPPRPRRGRGAPPARRGRTTVRRRDRPRRHRRHRPGHRLPRPGRRPRPRGRGQPVRDAARRARLHRVPRRTPVDGRG